MSECVDLMERFGKRYRIEFDPAYDSAHRPKDKLDPWYMVVLCERGEVYPQGGDLLVAEVEGRAVTANRLRVLDSVTVKQDGDDFLAVTFHVRDFAQIAKILKPRRRRQLSEAQLAMLAEKSAPFRFKPRCSDAPQVDFPRSDSPDGSNIVPAHSDAKLMAATGKNIDARRRLRHEAAR